MTYRHCFDSWPPPPKPHDAPAADEGRRPTWERATHRLRGAVDRGLTFYWTLASAASEVAGGARSCLEIEASRRPESSRFPVNDAGSGLHPWESSSHLEYLLPAVSTSLVIEREDTSGDARAALDADLSAFTNAAEPLVTREQWHRAVRCHRSECRAIESQAAHDLRTLLQPLQLHVDQLGRTESATPQQLQLLDDLTRAVVEWVEEDIEGEGLSEELRLPPPSPADGTDLRSALGEALDTGTQGVLTASVPGQLPELAVDRPVLVAGLEELLQFSVDGTENLRADRVDGSSVRLRIEFDTAPAAAESRKPNSDDLDYPPVVGGLLNLVAWGNASLRVEAAPERGGVIDVRLPLDSPEEPNAV